MPYAERQRQFCMPPNDRRPEHVHGSGGKLVGSDRVLLSVSDCVQRKCRCLSLLVVHFAKQSGQALWLMFHQACIVSSLSNSRRAAPEQQQLRITCSGRARAQGRSTIASKDYRENFSKPESFADYGHGVKRLGVRKPQFEVLVSVNWSLKLTRDFKRTYYEHEGAGWIIGCLCTV